MKRFGAAILQLDIVSTNTVMQAVKQAIHPNTKFFDSLSLHPSTTVNELFQRVNQFALLEEDTLATTKRTVAFMSDLGQDN